jgi:hypothetical protein
MKPSPLKGPRSARDLRRFDFFRDFVNLCATGRQQRDGICLGGRMGWKPARVVVMRAVAELARVRPITTECGPGHWPGWAVASRAAAAHHAFLRSRSIAVLCLWRGRKFGDNQWEMCGTSASGAPPPSSLAFAEPATTRTGGPPLGAKGPTQARGPFRTPGPRPEQPPRDHQRGPASEAARALILRICMQKFLTFTSRSPKMVGILSEQRRTSQWQ